MGLPPVYPPMQLDGRLRRFSVGHWWLFWVLERCAVQGMRFHVPTLPMLVKPQDVVLIKGDSILSQMLT